MPNSNPRIQHIDSWRDFVTLADNLYPTAIDEVTYVFRGQSDAQWHLSPSLLRYNPERNRERLLRLEAKLLAEFEARVHLVAQAQDLLPKQNYESLPERWAVMQHHGAPTRLLDWTLSGYVAAYFAVSGSPERDGAVYIASAGITCRETSENEPESPHPILLAAETDQRLLGVGSRDRLQVWFPPHKSQRLAAQQGLFMYAEDVVGDHEAQLAKGADYFREKFGPALLFDKCIIPAGLKGEFLSRLRGMNIGAHTLFPGLDGLGRYIAESARIGLAGADQ